jgi:hypothetical protein
MRTAENKTKAIQIRKPKNLGQLAKQIDGKYYGALEEIRFENLPDIAYLLTDSAHQEDEPTQAYFQGERTNLEKARNIQHDLKGCRARFCLRTGFVLVKRPPEVREIYHYDVIIRKELQRRIKLIPELAVLLKSVQQYY